MKSTVDIERWVRIEARGWRRPHSNGFDRSFAYPGYPASIHTKDPSSGPEARVAGSLSSTLSPSFSLSPAAAYRAWRTGGSRGCHLKLLPPSRTSDPAPIHRRSPPRRSGPPRPTVTPLSPPPMAGSLSPPPPPTSIPIARGLPPRRGSVLAPLAFSSFFSTYSLFERPEFLRVAAYFLNCREL